MMHKISYEYEHLHIKYKVYIEKRKSDRLTLYIGEYLFLNQLNNPNLLKAFLNRDGRLSPFEKDIIDHIKIINIVRQAEPEPPMFKPFQ